MTTLAHIALSGMNAARAQLDVAAHNIANLNTPGFRRHEVVQQSQAEGGVSTVARRQSEAEGDALAQDVVQQLQAKNAFLANLAVFKRSDEALGSLLDSKV
jgi:flagellar basal body rod protein FlgG